MSAVRKLLRGLFIVVNVAAWLGFIVGATCMAAPPKMLAVYLDKMGVPGDVQEVMTHYSLWTPAEKPATLAANPESSPSGDYATAGESLIEWQKAHADCGCRITSIYAKSEQSDPTASHRIWYIKTEPTASKEPQQIIVQSLSGVNDEIVFFGGGLDDAVRTALGRDHPGLLPVAVAVTDWRSNPHEAPHPAEAIVVAEKRS